MSARRAPAETTLRVFARYALFQAPGWLAASVAAIAAIEWLGVAPWIAAGAGALWFAKDLALFPFVRRAYERSPTTHGEVDERGVAEGPIDPDGWVRIGPERWRARLAVGAPSIEAGAAVRVVAVEGLVLRVQRLE